MKAVTLVLFLALCQSTFSADVKKCDDIPSFNCEVMKALCKKGVKVNETLIEDACPRTCNHCPVVDVKLLAGVKPRNDQKLDEKSLKIVNETIVTITTTAKISANTTVKSSLNGTLNLELGNSSNSLGYFNFVAIIMLSALTFNVINF